MHLIKRIRRKLANIIFNQYAEIAELHNEYLKSYPNMAGFIYDRISLEMMFNGLYEKNYLETLSKKILNKDYFRNTICLDVGANIGNHSLFFSNYFDKVYCFEPHPESFELLKFNSRNNSNINVYNYGLSDKSGVFELGVEQVSSIGSARIYDTKITDEKLRTKYSGNIFEVNLRIFDEIEKFKSIYDKISFVKIDVEHHEVEVIKGMEFFLKEIKPLIAFEILSDEFFLDNNKRKSDIILNLKELGYNIFYEVMGNKKNEINLIENFENKKYSMVLALNKEINI